MKHERALPNMDSEFKDYLHTYEYQGSDWTFEIRARSPEDARARLLCMRDARFEGEVLMKVTAPNWFVDSWIGKSALRVLKFFLGDRVQ